MSDGPDSPPTLAFQLERAVKELEEAEVRYDQVRELRLDCRNKKRKLRKLRAAARLCQAEQSMGRVADQILSNEKLFLYTMKEVEALLALLQWLEKKGRGRGHLRSVVVNCDNVFIASEMRQALRDLGLKEVYELPPAGQAA